MGEGGEVEAQFWPNCLITGGWMYNRGRQEASPGTDRRAEPRDLLVALNKKLGADDFPDVG
jgi:hypothetical protein